LYLAAASGWWDGSRWAPAVAALAAVATVALGIPFYQALAFMSWLEALG
jgi:hypothetical protein